MRTPRRISRSWPYGAGALTTLLVAACAAVTGLEPPEHDLASMDGAVDSRANDGAEGSDGTTDAPTDTLTAAEADAPTCASASETIPSVRDANLTFGGTHQDLSGVTICNLAQLHCLLAFTQSASLGKRLVSVTLQVPRATSAECGGSGCTGASFQGMGSISARNMRTDWTGKGFWFQRTVNAADTWEVAGALGANDATAMLATVAVASAAPSANLTIDGALLKPEFSAAGTLAFLLEGPFEFVIQRTTGSAASRPTLLVTYCTDVNDGG